MKSKWKRLLSVTLVVCLIAGITVSYVWATPAGASVVVVNLICFLLFSAWRGAGRLRG